MKWLELTVEGLPGVAAPLQFALEPKLTVIRNRGSLAIDFVAPLLENLLYPNLDRATPLGPAKSRRASLTFQTRDGVYRVNRDFESKKSHLFQMERGTSKQFRELTHDPRAIMEAFVRIAKVPSRSLYLGFFVARPGTFSPLPSNAKEGIDSSSAPVAVGDREKLTQLRAERERIELIRVRETRLDEVQARLFQVEDQIRRLEGPRGIFARLETEYADYRYLDEPGLLTPKILERLAEYPKLDEKKAETLKDIEERVRSLSEEMSAISNRPVWKEPLLIVGAASSLVAFVLSTFFRKWLWVLLGTGMASLGGVAIGAYLSLQKVEKREALARKMKGTEGEKAGLSKRFEIETTAIRNFFERVKTRDLDEVHDILARHRSLREEMGKAEAAVKEVEVQVPEKLLMQERTQLTDEVRKIESELRKLPAVSVDPNALDRQIRDLEMALSSPGTPHPPERASDHDANVLFSFAAECIRLPALEIARKAEASISANVMTVSRRNVAAVNWEGGKLRTFRNPSGGDRTWAELDSATQSDVWFGVQFTLWQMISPVFEFPLLVDLTSAGLEASEVGMKAATHLSNRAQVVVLAR